MSWGCFTKHNIMPTFIYKTVTESGEKRENQAFFLSDAEMHQSINTDEYLISYKVIDSKEKKISRNNLLSFTSQLSSMTSNGVKVDQSLEYIAQSKNQSDIKQLASELLERVRSGSSFSDSLYQSSIFIPQYYISAVKGGEESNNLDKAMLFLYQYIKDADQGSKKIVSALMYPMFVFFIAIVACSYMLLEVVPEMQKNYVSIGQELPDITINIIALSDFLKDYGLFLIISIVSIIGFIKATFATIYRIQYLKIISKIPLIGKTLRFADNYNILMTAGLLIRQGVAIDVSLNIAKSGMFFLQNKPGMSECIKSIRSGLEVSDALFDAGVLDTTTVGIMRSGEISNVPGERMVDVAKIIKERRDKLLGYITSMIGPISIVIVGMMILFIALGMLMPMFNLNEMEF